MVSWPEYLPRPAATSVAMLLSASAAFIICEHQTTHSFLLALYHISLATLITSIDLSYLPLPEFLLDFDLLSTSFTRGISYTVSCLVAVWLTWQCQVHMIAHMGHHSSSDWPPHAISLLLDYTACAISSAYVLKGVYRLLRGKEPALQQSQFYFLYQNNGGQDLESGSQDDLSMMESSDVEVIGKPPSDHFNFQRPPLIVHVQIEQIISESA